MRHLLLAFVVFASPAHANWLTNQWRGHFYSRCSAFLAAAAEMREVPGFTFNIPTIRGLLEEAKNDPALAQQKALQELLRPNEEWKWFQSFAVTGKDSIQKLLDRADQLQRMVENRYDQSEADKAENRVQSFNPHPMLNSRPTLNTVGLLVHIMIYPFLVAPFMDISIHPTYYSLLGLGLTMVDMPYLLAQYRLLPKYRIFGKFRDWASQETSQIIHRHYRLGRGAIAVFKRSNPVAADMQEILVSTMVHETTPLMIRGFISTVASPQLLQTIDFYKRLEEMDIYSVFFRRADGEPVFIFLMK